MPVLHLGVMDVPYAYERETLGKPGKNGKRKVKRKLMVSTSMTTGDVAEILEAKYHLMELFFEEHSQHGMITDAIAESMAGALESIAMGAPPTMDPYAAATEAIDQAFRVFITEGAVERLGIPGTPTQAALSGVSHRKVRPYASSNPRRPSFVDTGLYVGSFKSWVD